MYSVADWYESLKLVLEMLAEDVDRMKQALDAGNIGDVRQRFPLLYRDIQHTCRTWQPPSLSLDHAVRDVLAWRREQFPLSTPASTMTHLKREMLELEAAPADPGEIADMLMLLAGLADLQHINLADAVSKKLAINKARDWGERDADGVIEHVREGQP